MLVYIMAYYFGIKIIGMFDVFSFIIWFRNSIEYQRYIMYLNHTSYYIFFFDSVSSFVVKNSEMVLVGVVAIWSVCLFVIGDSCWYWSVWVLVLLLLKVGYPDYGEVVGWFVGINICHSDSTWLYVFSVQYFLFEIICDFNFGRLLKCFVDFWVYCCCI